MRLTGYCGEHMQAQYIGTGRIIYIVTDHVSAESAESAGYALGMYMYSFDYIIIAFVFDVPTLQL